MYIKVIARAGSKKEVVLKKDETKYEISIKEKAERNMANDRIRQILSEIFMLPKSKIRLISGHHSPSKMYSVDTDE